MAEEKTVGKTSKECPGGVCAIPEKPKITVTETVLGISLEMKDVTGKPIKCDIDAAHPNGVGDPEACKALKEELRKTQPNPLTQT